jgi:nitrogen fixation/metabolism regulation signal transduction histidine kinase
MSNVYDALTKAGEKNQTMSALGLSLQGISLDWKIMILVLGLLFLVIVNQLMGRALRIQMDESAVIIATNLSDAAAGYIASKDVLQLKTTLTKYARLSRVAYAFIKDREGKVIAHSLAAFPPELQQELTSDQRRQASRRELTLQGKTVHETREPILDGQLGTAHIGIWADAVEREIYHTMFLFVWPITLALFAAVVIAVFLAPSLIRALRRLIELRLGSQATSTHP